MKRILQIGLMLITVGAYAQNDNVGIGTVSPDNSAILDLNSSNKGFLLPRMTKEQKIGITNPAQGLQIYQTDGNAGIYVFDGAVWVNSANSVAALTDPWLYGGNSVGSTDFIGTTNAEALRFKVNNITAGRIEPGQNTFIGYHSGTNTTGGNNTGFGYLTLYQSTGVNNTAFGSDAMTYNTLGYGNTAMGTAALKANTTGFENFALGSFSMTQNNGNENVAIGYRSMFSTTSATNNIAIGSRALENSITGNGNIAIGTGAGQGELGNDKLYIANSNTTMPLIYGDFSAKFVSIGDVEPGTKREVAVSNGGYKLLVQGGILTEKIKVALKSQGDWADYVFEKDYKLMPLAEVEKFVKENNHLPNVPSASNLMQEGLDLGTINKVLMEKVEELTLYIIQLDKEIKSLKN